MEIDLGLLRDETYSTDARYVWEYSRGKLKTCLDEGLSLHGEFGTTPTPIRQLSQFALVCFIGRFLYSIIFMNWLWAPKKRDWLIFPRSSHRKILGERGEMYDDIHTGELIDEIGIDKCVIIETPFQRRHYTPRRYKVFHSDFLFLLNKIIEKVLPFCIIYDLTAINNMIQDIKEYIEKRIGQKEIDIEKVFNIKPLFARYIAYLFMLKWLKPKRVLFIFSEMYIPIVRAARILHIPTVELQHGTLAPEHLVYSVPDGMTKKYFADYYLLFGKYWKETMDNLPLPPDRSIILGYPYFEKIFVKNSNLINRKNQIVVISQGTIGKELTKFSAKLAVLIQGKYKIYYKFHPDEWGRNRTVYPELYEAKEKGLLDVLDTDTPPLYTLLSQSRWQIGVYSTALFEGIAFGCQPILVDLPGIEYMAPLLKTGKIQLVKTPEEIQFSETENLMDLREELFASDWRYNWRKFEQMDLRCRFQN